MNEEIKEILDYLTKSINSKDFVGMMIRKDHLDKLLDYITNLQEELKDLKMRKDVVIDYIEKKEKDDDNWIGYELLVEPIRIKNILGGDEE